MLIFALIDALCAALCVAWVYFSVRRGTSGEWDVVQVSAAILLGGAVLVCVVWCWAAVLLDRGELAALFLWVRHW